MAGKKKARLPYLDKVGFLGQEMVENGFFPRCETLEGKEEKEREKGEEGGGARIILQCSRW